MTVSTILLCIVWGAMGLLASGLAWEVTANYRAKQRILKAWMKQQQKEPDND